MPIWWRIYSYFERRKNVLGSFKFKNKKWTIYFLRAEKGKHYFHIRNGLKHLRISMEKPDANKKPPKGFGKALDDFLKKEIENNPFGKTNWEFLLQWYIFTGNHSEKNKIKKLKNQIIRG